MNTTINSHVNTALQRNGGIAAIGMALCYMLLFVIFGALLSLPDNTDMLVKLQAIQEQKLLLSISYVVGYLLFGSFLLVTVQAVHNRMQQNQSSLLNTASLFGFIWVVLMMCSGMTALVGMEMTNGFITEKPEIAVSLFFTSNMMLQALGGGIELVGGLWVLILSAVALRDNHFSKALNLLGLIVGSLGVLTIFQSIPYLKDLFGLIQIVWFIWLAISLMKTDPVNRQTKSVASDQP